MTPGGILQSWFARRKGDRLDLCFGGRIFGGRPGESPQELKACQRVGPALVFSFATTERLVVLDPATVELGEQDSLIVPKASEVRFGWHYYGRPQLPENWCEEIYRPDGDGLQLVRLGALLPGVERFPAHGAPVLRIAGSPAA